MKTKLLGLAFVLIYSCELVIDVDTPDFQPTLVLNSIIYPDSTIVVELSRDRYILDGAEFDPVSGAQVVLFENDLEVETLREMEAMYEYQKGYYQSSTRPKPGMTYRVEVTAEGFDNLTAEEVLPEQPPVFEISNLDVFTTDFGQSSIQLDLQIDDQTGENYYRIVPYVSYNFRTSIIDPLTEMEVDTTFRFTEALYGTTENLAVDDHLQDALLFTDQLFEGKSYSLNLEVIISSGLIFDHPDLDEDPKLIFELRSVSASYFDYFNTSELQQWVANDPFAESVQVSSNIENGRGIFASYLVSVVEFDL